MFQLFKKWKEVISFLSMLGSVVAGIYAFVTYEKIVKINQIADRNLIITGNVISNFELELKPSDPNQILVEGMLQFPIKYSPNKISFTNNNNKVNLFGISQGVANTITDEQKYIQKVSHINNTTALTINQEAKEIIVPVYIEATFNAKNEKITNSRLYFVKYAYTNNSTKPAITMKLLISGKEMSKEEADYMMNGK